MTVKKNDNDISVNETTFCLMPWVHFHMDTMGKVKACCSTSITYGQLSANSDRKSLKKIWNSKAAMTFRKKMMSGIADKRCSGCYDREAAGKSSMRTETLAKYSDMVENVFKTTDLEGYTSLEPVYLDLRFSNVCNLRCRTCWHGASSSWFEEAKVLNNQVVEKAIIKATTNNISVLKSIVEFSADPVEIYFAGGEPLLMEEHYALLNLTKDHSDKVMLRYNTNLSMLKFKQYDLPKIWSKFKNVRISVSVDA